MFRARHRVQLGSRRPLPLVPATPSSFYRTLRHARRLYTPITAPDPRVDHVAPLRSEDEVRALWAPQPLVPSIAAGVTWWLRVGNDPVVHTALDPMRSRNPPQTDANDNIQLPRSTSPFAYVEDIAGTNLISGNAAQVRESAALWSAYYTRKYLGHLRQSRRTAANYVGQASQDELQLQDEADQPNTTWAQDTYFQELAFLSERHLKVRVSSMRQLEEVLWYTVEPEAFVAFFDALQQQTALRIPLPAPAIWFYEGEARKAWAMAYLPAAHAARSFFDTVIAQDLKALATETGQSEGQAEQVLLQRVAAVMERVHAIELRRADRQSAAGIRPTWPNNTNSNSEAQEAWTANELERWQRAVQEAVYDPEDLLDDSAEWKAENHEIEALVREKIEGCQFTLYDFWLHTIRREELETQHILEDDHLRRVAAAARNALYHECSLAEVHTGIAESVRRGQLDMRAAVLRPQCNPIWCKLHYAKFGASGIVQRTHTATRQLLFHHAATVQAVAATAQLYFTAGKPLSSALDYNSPYTLRRSLVRLCASYGVDMTHAIQRPVLLSAAHIAHAEEQIGGIVQHTAQAFGRQRRRLAKRTASTALNGSGMEPVTSVRICEPRSELLEAGEALVLHRDEYTNTTASNNEEEEEDEQVMWPLGSRKTIKYRWQSALLQQLRELARQTERRTSLEYLQEREKLTRGARLELSLWRQCSPESERQARAELDASIAESLRVTPTLAEVQLYARRFFTHLTGQPAPTLTTTSSETIEPSSNAEKNNDEDEEWVFAVMLDDQAWLNELEQAEVYLPYVDAEGKALPAGQYRLRLRIHDERNANKLLYSEAVSQPFPVFDALPQLIEQFRTAHADGSTPTPVQQQETQSALSIPAADWVAFCEFLRDGGLDVPLRCEFEAGQSLDVRGNVLLEPFLTLLRGNEHHRAQCEQGITDVQRRIEPDCRAHWELYHPGASAEEWACVRRAVLHHAMARERDWWLPDPMLYMDDCFATASARHKSLDFALYPAAARYANTLCGVLSAEGQSHVRAPQDDKLPTTVSVTNTVMTSDESSSSGKSTGDTGSDGLRASCVVDGTGALTELSFDRATSHVRTSDALQTALRAITNAQTRHCTLSMYKTGPFAKQAQVSLFCAMDGLEFGGKYARTYCYAVNKAKEQLAQTVVSGRQVPGVGDKDKERRSEQETEVDRFASDSHPEQRKNLFAPRTTLSGVPIEDPTPDQTSTWGR